MSRIDDLYTPANERLFDLLFRHQVYLEGAKRGVAQRFAPVLDDLYGTIEKYFYRQRYQRMDDYTKAELVSFIRDLRRSLATIFNAYTRRLIALLEAFLKVDYPVQTVLVASVQPLLPAKATAKNPGLLSDYAIALDQWIDTQPPALVADMLGVTGKAAQAAVIETLAVPALTPDEFERKLPWLLYTTKKIDPDSVRPPPSRKQLATIWSAALAAPVPATGVTLAAMVATWENGSQDAIASAVMKGYANSDTAVDTAAAILGVGTLTTATPARTIKSSNRSQSGLLGRIRAQHDSLVHTLTQHVSSESIAEVFHVADANRYQWVSVMDNRTTPICRLRDGRIYSLGGPLPPAHHGCRSTVVPLLDS